ncbi:MAG: RNase adapter RapZ [Acidobacteria bacterium]|nr:RNase adapter RapZ [Acidobacteriota bacterium]
MDERAFHGPFVITGLSGAGKTVLSRSLEDIGYHCVDNIPLELVTELFENTPDIERLVVVLDVRTGGFAEGFPEIRRRLCERWPDLRVIFVEASPEVLLRRFSVARRPHPLRGFKLADAIAREAEDLAGLRDTADLVIDSSELNPHELRRRALGLGGLEDPRQLMTVDVESFSYLHGVPAIASLVFDVRFLPNPYFIDELRGLPGDSPEVESWMAQFPEVGEAMELLTGVVLKLLPRYAAELKSHITIAAGCTGGRHRSVYTARHLAEAIAKAGYQAALHHRDKDRWRYP